MSPKLTLKSGRNSSIINNTDNNSILSERINEHIVDEFVENKLPQQTHISQGDL